LRARSEAETSAPSDVFFICTEGRRSASCFVSFRHQCSLLNWVINSLKS